MDSYLGRDKLNSNKYLVVLMNGEQFEVFAESWEAVTTIAPYIVKRDFNNSSILSINYIP